MTFASHSAWGDDSECVVPTVVRKNASGKFKDLEHNMVPTAHLDHQSIWNRLKCEHYSGPSVMWSGVRTHSPRDHCYQMILAVMEATISALVDDAVGYIRDRVASQPLAVFLRRIYSHVLPVSGRAVEDAFVEYDKRNLQFFGPDASNDEIEEKERRLDELDAEMSVLQEEISAWEILQKQGDLRALEFARNTADFAAQLQHVESADMQGKFWTGGKHPIPKLDDWEHPETRYKKRIQASLEQEISEAMGAPVHSLFPAMGVPLGAFCFEPGVSVDERWNNIRFQPWCVGQTENSNPTQSPVYVEGDKLGQPATRRLSMEAVKVFHP